MESKLKICLFLFFCLFAGASQTFAQIDEAIISGFSSYSPRNQEVFAKETLYENGVFVGEKGKLKLGLFDHLVTIRFDQQLFLGWNWYEGYNWGVPPPTTDVFYAGFGANLGLGLHLKLGNFSIEPFSGVGTTAFVRNVYDPVDNGNWTNYDNQLEDWLTFFWQAGTEIEYQLSEKVRLFANAGFRLGLYNSVAIPVLGYTLNPGGDWSAFGEVGIRLFSRLYASVLYEGLRFKGSNNDSPRPYYFYQSKSQSDFLGICVGFIIK
jgi:hypothetical protein